MISGSSIDAGWFWKSDNVILGIIFESCIWENSSKKNWLKHYMCEGSAPGLLNRLIPPWGAGEHEDHQWRSTLSASIWAAISSDAIISCHLFWGHLIVVGSNLHGSDHSVCAELKSINLECTASIVSLLQELKRYNTEIIFTSLQFLVCIISLQPNYLAFMYSQARSKLLTLLRKSADRCKQKTKTSC